MIDYFAKGKVRIPARSVAAAPSFYRNNWYLDAWCHLREDVRAFALDSIRRAEILEKRARDVRALPQSGAWFWLRHLFGNRGALGNASLHARARRWVANERWHPQQESKTLKDGAYELRIPYTKDPELLMDILKFGADCQVIAPKELRDRVAAEVRRMAKPAGVSLIGPAHRSIISARRHMGEWDAGRVCQPAAAISGRPHRRERRRIARCRR